MYFFISRGQGFWILASLFIAFVAADGVAHFVPSRTEPKWPVIAALIIAGIVSLGLGIHAQTSPPRPFLERQTGRERVLRPVHSVYGLRAEYWAVLYLWTAWLLAHHGA